MFILQDLAKHLERSKGANINKSFPDGYEEKIQKEKGVMADLGKLRQIKQIIEEIYLGKIDPIIGIKNIGVLFNDIAWDENNVNCVRNKHGYRNRSKKRANQRNQTGAKLDFEILSKLKELAVDQEFNFLLTAHKNLVDSSLQNLEKKIIYILRAEGQDISLFGDAAKVENSEIGFLRTISAFYNDFVNINRLIKMLEDYPHLSMGFSEKIDRCQLGYFFIQIGELAKEISDFLKPETFEKFEKNVTRAVFTKLGHYRQKIKDMPAIVYEDNPISLASMKVKFEDSRKELIEFLIAVRQKLQGFLEGKDGRRLNGECIVINIDENYPNVNQVDKKSEKELSSFEEIYYEKISRLTHTLEEGTKTYEEIENSLLVQLDEEHRLRKKIEHELKEVEEELEKNQKEDLADIPSEQEGELAKEIKQLMDAAFYNQGAKQTIGLACLYYGISTEQLYHLGFKDEHIKVINLIGGQKRPMSKGEKLEDKMVVLKKLIEKYIIGLNKALEKYNKKLDELNIPSNILPHVSPLEHEKLFLFLKKKEKKGEAEAQELLNKRAKLCAQLKGQEKRSEALEDKLKKNKEDYKYFLEKICLKEQQKKKKGLEREKIKKSESLLKKIIRDIEMLQEIYVRIEEAQACNNQKYHTKLVMAEKMVFAILGQNHKIFKERYSDIINPNLISNSILSGDIFQVILTRHKSVAHNTFKCDQALVHKMVQHKITPWLKDFKCMSRLFLTEIPEADIQIETIRGVDDRIVDNMENLSIADKNLFYKYTKIVALNRFIRSHEAIELYMKIKDEITLTTHPELALEIHWQASLAYRHLGKFEEVIPILEMASQIALNIQDIRTKNLKLYGVYLDLGVAYVQVDKNKEARKYFSKVILENVDQGNATDYQVICANCMIGSIEAVEGNCLIAKKHLELTLVKYLDKLLQYDAVLILSLLSQLASLYMDTLDIDYARDCLKYAESFLEANFRKVVSKVGQYAIYHKIFLQSTMARYKIIEALVGPESDIGSQLNIIHSSLLEDQNHRKALVYPNKNGASDFPLICTMVLGCGDKKEAHKLIKNTLYSQRKEDVKQLLEKINVTIKAIKIEIFEFYIFSISLSKEEDPGVKGFEHANKLNKLAIEVSSGFTSLSLASFLEGNFRQAYAYMQQAILSQLIVEFFEYDLECLIESAEGETDFEKWYNNTLFEVGRLKRFVNRTLNDPRFNETRYLQKIEKSIIARLKDAEGDKKQYGELVKNLEIELQMISYLEAGRPTFFVKVIDDVLVQRFITRDPNGNLSIEERRSAFNKQQDTEKGSRVEPSSQDRFDISKSDSFAMSSSLSSSSLPSRKTEAVITDGSRKEEVEDEVLERRYSGGKSAESFATYPVLDETENNEQELLKAIAIISSIEQKIEGHRGKTRSMENVEDDINDNEQELLEMIISSIEEIGGQREKVSIMGNTERGGKKTVSSPKNREQNILQARISSSQDQKKNKALKLNSSSSFSSSSSSSSYNLSSSSSSSSSNFPSSSSSSSSVCGLVLPGGKPIMLGSSGMIPKGGEKVAVRKGAGVAFSSPGRQLLHQGAPAVALSSATAITQEDRFWIEKVYWKVENGTQTVCSNFINDQTQNHFIKVFEKLGFKGDCFKKRVTPDLQRYLEFTNMQKRQGFISVLTQLKLIEASPAAAKKTGKLV